MFPVWSETAALGSRSFSSPVMVWSKRAPVPVVLLDTNWPLEERETVSFSIVASFVPLTVKAFF